MLMLSLFAAAAMTLQQPVAVSHLADTTHFVALAGEPRTNAPAPVPSAPVWSPSLAPLRGPIDSIVVEKAAHRMTMFRHGLAVRAYLVALGRQPVGDKQVRGDRKTPEGVFHIDARNAESRYHKSLHISYPDASHRERAHALGADPGGDIMIHGLPHGYEMVGAAHRDEDWTEGCIAVTNEEIDDIFHAVQLGTVIDIRP